MRDNKVVAHEGTFDGPTRDVIVARLQNASANAPASASAAGVAGDLAYDASFFYVCVAKNTWKRAAIATW